MTYFQVGRKFPQPNVEPGNERVLLQRNNAFFDVLYYAPMAAQDAPTWRRGELKFGLSEPTPGVAMVLFEFSPEWQFDVTLNLRKAATEQQQRNWLDSESNRITLYLIDSSTNVLHGMRMIGVPSAWADELRAVARRQLERFTSVEVIDHAISIQEAVPLSEMIRTTQMLTTGS